MSPPPSDATFWKAYAESDQDLRIRHAKVGCLLALILMPAGVTLDFFVYPHLLGTILTGRLLCDVAILPIYLLLFTAVGRRWIRVIGALWPLLPAVSIAWMIAITEGASSPYYAGLNLVIIIACVLMPYTWRDAVAVCAITIVLYAGACLLHHRLNPETTTTIADVFGNLYFISLTAIITITATHYFNIRRIEDYHLRHQLDQRNREVNASYAKLAELDRQRSQFFANISHELRTPLTLIIAPIQDLLADRSQIPPAAAAALDIAQQNALRLLKLINDLLELVRLDVQAKAIKLEPLELTGLLRSLGESVRYLAEAKNLHLLCKDTGSSLVINGDASRIEKIVLNLLSNAIKFTPENGHITIECRKSSDSAIIEVVDTGEGIPAADLPHIFERFRQVDGSSTRKYQGAGIGLSLVQELVDEHGGRISATSTVGHGTTMRIEIPLVAVADPSREPIRKNEEDSDRIAQIYQAAERVGSIDRKPTDESEESEVRGLASGSVVLVVDDEPDMRHYLVSRLVERFTVHQCGHGERAVAMARRIKPDLILLDLMLPGIDGIGVCKLLREDEALRETRIILLTARMDEATKLEALRGGADDFLTKPFSTPEVITRVSTQLRTHDLQRSLRRRGDELQEALENLRSTKAQLIQSEKMNALGVLSAGILHEINNPLNFAMTALQVARSGLPADQMEREAVDDAISGMERIRNIVKGLGAFAHKNADQAQEVISLGGVVDLAMRLCSHETSGIALDLRVADDLRIRGSETQLSQVVVNLIINACHAVKDPNVTGRKPAISVVGARDADRVRLTVRDNGTGIPADKIARIFEPFYTTRPVGSGWGLGLSICHTIVSDHGGDIAITSEPNAWTECVIDFPLPKDLR